MQKNKLTRQEKAILKRRRKLKRKQERSARFSSFLHKFTLRAYSDPVITIAVLGLVLFGSFMIVSTDVGQTTTDSSVVLTTLIKQIVYIVIAYLLMWLVNHVFSFRWFTHIQSIFILGIGFLMILPFAFSASGGSHAWIRLPGGVTVQPSEFAKPLMIILIANALYQAKSHPKMLNSFTKLFRAPIIGLVVVAGLLVAQKDIGTMVIIVMISFICVLVPDYPSIRRWQKNLKRLFVIGLVVGIGLFWVTDIGTNILAQTPFSHIATRIENAKNPYNDVYGEGYQPANSLYGIASSNIVGKGIGQSARKYGYLTQADNDYILAVVIEETGIFGLGIITFGYATLIIRLFYYAFKTNEPVYKVVLTGNAAYLFMHFFLNVGGVAALIPFTGVPLLFISSGGSSLMAIFIAVGLSQQCISQIRTKEIGV